MTYIPSDILPSLGFIQASAITTNNLSNVVMDIDNSMGTTENAGVTDLKATSVVVMTLSRDDDGLSYGYGSFYSDATQSDVRYLGVLKSENNNYMQGGEWSFAYSNNIDCTQYALAPGNLVINNYSHAKIWRLST
tara:strand:- start:124 stop:528 length:405 start_codon:yes stop_codon:yes gene_type:complete